MERGMDPQVKKLFRKILNSFVWGLLWMMAGAAGIYYGFASPQRKPVIQPILFYAFMLLTLVLLIWYLIRSWKNEI